MRKLFALVVVILAGVMAGWTWDEDSASPARARAQSRTIATECWTRDRVDRLCYYTVYERDPWTPPDFPHYSLVASGTGYLMHFTVPYNTDGFVQAIVQSPYCNGYGQIVTFPAYSGYQYVGLAIPCG